MKRKQAQSTRYERWINLVAAHLRAQHIDCKLTYDDRHQGDRLVMSASLEEGFAELQVVRSKKGANLCVLVQSQATASRLAELLRNLHRSAKRRHNAKRKFLHRVEWMSAHLQQTFDARQAQFPGAALERVQQLIPEAQSLTGVRAPFKKKAEPKDERLELEAATGRLARQLKRYKLLFAALIPTAQGGRAALYYKNTDSFCPRGEALNVVVKGLKASGADPHAVALLAPLTPEGAERDWGDILEGVVEGADAALDVVDVMGVAAELADSAGSADSCWDVGGCDLPDCGGLDVPDCGGLDCSI